MFINERISSLYIIMSVCLHFLVFSVSAMEKAETFPLALHEAAFRGDKVSIQSLLNAGMDINQRDIDGNTPLHKACAANRLDVVEFLHSRGADLHAKNKKGLKAFETDVRFPEIVKFFNRNGVGFLEYHSVDDDVLSEQDKERILLQQLKKPSESTGVKEGISSEKEPNYVMPVLAGALIGSLVAEGVRRTYNWWYGTSTEVKSAENQKPAASKKEEVKAGSLENAHISWKQKLSEATKEAEDAYAKKR